MWSLSAKRWKFSLSISFKEASLNFHNIYRALISADYIWLANKFAHKIETFIQILRTFRLTRAVLHCLVKLRTRVVILIISTLTLSLVIHTGAHLVNFRRYSTNYSLDFTDLNFALYPNQVRVCFILVFFSPRLQCSVTETRASLTRANLKFVIIVFFRKCPQMPLTTWRGRELLFSRSPACEHAWKSASQTISAVCFLLYCFVKGLRFLINSDADLRLRTVPIVN